MIQVIRKHLVRRDYLDFGSRLETRYATASSVDDSGAIPDRNDFADRASAERHIAEWLASEAVEAARLSQGWRVERGEDVFRKVDMNPHGLI